MKKLLLASILFAVCGCNDDPPNLEHFPPGSTEIKHIKDKWYSFKFNNKSWYLHDPNTLHEALAIIPYEQKAEVPAK